MRDGVEPTRMKMTKMPPIAVEDTEPLDSLTKEEFWRVCLKIKPDYTSEQYDIDWEAFQRRKADGRLVTN